MRNLFLLLLRFREGLIYLIFSIACLYFAVNFDHIERVNWLHASNSVGGAVHKGTSGINSYLELKSENNTLVSFNSKLMSEIDLLNAKNQILLDSLFRIQLLSVKKDTSIGSDSTKRINRSLDNLKANTSYIPCRIVYNTTVDNENYLTIDKGSLDGIEQGFGIITEKGILGKVVSTSEHYSLVKSVLHVHNSISAKMKNSNELGSAKWDGKSSKYLLLTEIPRHLAVKKGDTVVTTSYNSVYPAGHPIGKVFQVIVDENQPFWKIKVELFENLNQITHCFAYKNDLFEEKLKLIAKKDSIY